MDLFRNEIRHSQEEFHRCIAMNKELEMMKNKHTINQIKYEKQEMQMYNK